MSNTNDTRSDDKANFRCSFLGLTNRSHILSEDTMPDRDNIPRGVPSKFSRAYKQLCEWQLPEDEIAREASKALLKQAQEYGDAPLKLINQVSQELEKVTSTPLFPIDWDKLIQDVEEFQKNTNGNKRAMEYVVEVIKSHITSIRHNLSSLHGDHYPKLVKGYLQRLYEGFFKAPIMIAPEHLEGETLMNIEERLNRIGSYVEEYITENTEKIVNSGTIEKLRPPKNPKRDEPIDLFEDIRNL